jgi:hypothetical protein
MPPINAVDPITISHDAEEMGMATADFRFLGSKRWQTYGKGIINTGLSNDKFGTSISDCGIQGQIRVIDGNNINIVLTASIEIQKIDASGRHTSSRYIK